MWIPYRLSDVGSNDEPGMIQDVNQPSTLDPSSAGTLSRADRKPAWRRGADRILGTSTISAATRILTVSYSVTLLDPHGYETSAPGYMALRTLMAVLVAMCGWFPGIAAILASVAFVLFNVAYPHFLNEFDTPLEVGAAVLLSQQRWRLYIATFVGLASGIASSYVLHTIDTEFNFIPTILSTVITMSLIGVAGIIMQERIDREVALKAEQRIKLERASMARRNQVMLDTHDTISHTLSSESSIMRELSRRSLSDADSKTVSELILVNNTGQHQFRKLLERIRRGTTDADPKQDLTSELRSASHGIASAAKAGGIGFKFEVDPAPVIVGRDLVDAILSMFYETSTNIIKHAERGTHATVQAFADNSTEPASWVLKSSNSSTQPLHQPPHSITRRAKHLGGGCYARTLNEQECLHTIEIQIQIPLPPVARHLTKSTLESGGLLD